MYPDSNVNDINCKDTIHYKTKKLKINVLLSNRNYYIT